MNLLHRFLPSSPRRMSKITGDTEAEEVQVQVEQDRKIRHQNMDTETAIPHQRLPQSMAVQIVGPVRHLRHHQDGVP